jgi:hypothetical protein
LDKLHSSSLEFFFLEWRREGMKTRREPKFKTIFRPDKNLSSYFGAQLKDLIKLGPII